MWSSDRALAPSRVANILITSLASKINDDQKGEEKIDDRNYQMDLKHDHESEVAG